MKRQVSTVVRRLNVRKRVAVAARLLPAVLLTLGPLSAVKVCAFILLLFLLVPSNEIIPPSLIKGGKRARKLASLANIKYAKFLPMRL